MEKEQIAGLLVAQWECDFGAGDPLLEDDERAALTTRIADALAAAAGLGPQLAYALLMVSPKSKILNEARRLGWLSPKGEAPR